MQTVEQIKEEIWECIKLEFALRQTGETGYLYVLPDFEKIPPEQFKEYIKAGIIRWIDGNVQTREEWDRFMEHWREVIQPWLNKKLAQINPKLFLIELTEELEKYEELYLGEVEEKCKGRPTKETEEEKKMEKLAKRRDKPLYPTGRK